MKKHVELTEKENSLLEGSELQMLMGGSAMITSITFASVAARYVSKVSLKELRPPMEKALDELELISKKYSPAVMVAALVMEAGQIAKAVLEFFTGKCEDCQYQEDCPGLLGMMDTSRKGLSTQEIKDIILAVQVQERETRLDGSKELLNNLLNFKFPHTHN